MYLVVLPEGIGPSLTQLSAGIGFIRPVVLPVTLKEQCITLELDDPVRIILGEK